jgi:phosphopantothenoylcysteine decarboxylase/phosphopantothenate--cysteine ligase
MIAKLAAGMGSDMVCCSALSLPANCKRIFCPAMNVQMWEQKIVADNCRKLLKYGWHQVGPEKGRLACGTYGYGRMSTPTVIAQVILNSVF